MKFKTLVEDFITSGSKDSHCFYWDKFNWNLEVHKYQRSLHGWSVNIEYVPSYEKEAKYTNEEVVEISFEDLFVFVYSKVKTED